MVLALDLLVLLLFSSALPHSTLDIQSSLGNKSGPYKELMVRTSLLGTP